jgi:hypothetical protein
MAKQERHIEVSASDLLAVAHAHSLAGKLGKPSTVHVSFTDNNQIVFLTDDVVNMRSVIDSVTR